MNNMKNIFYFLIVFPLVISSCGDILDDEPTDAISADQAINDKIGVDRAITGAYNALQAVGSYGRNQIIVSDLPADNLLWSGTTQEYSQIDLNAIAADNGTIEGIWAANYDGINRVNNVLYHLPGIADMSNDERNRYQGEALFLRALFHFNLAGFFGGVPIKTLPTLDLNNIDQARNSLEEVHNQVIADLEQAEQLLPVSMPIGHAGAFSATALLARVYLAKFHLTNQAESAQLATENATKVINEGGYIFTSPYVNLFISDPNSESIFEVVFDAQNSNRLAQYFYPRSLTGRYEVAPTTGLIQSYEAGDSRLGASIAFDAENKPYGVKYNDITAGTDRVYVLRLAEMYLIRAEAKAYSNGDIGEIRSDIDVIRSRAGLPPTTANDYASLKLAIENERRHEFAFEGQRWEDLVRTNRAATVLGIDENYTLFPIPLSEVQTNKLMTQNPGY
jgi:hypothetical protein